MREEQQKASADIAVRYPLCMKSEKCSRLCAARQDFFRSLRQRYEKDDFFHPVFFDGCEDYARANAKEKE